MGATSSDPVGKLSPEAVVGHDEDSVWVDMVKVFEMFATHEDRNKDDDEEKEKEKEREFNKSLDAWSQHSSSRLM
jgi:hypothetical protein